MASFVIAYSLIYVSIMTLMLLVANWLFNLLLKPDINLGHWWLFTILGSFFASHFLLKKKMRLPLRKAGWKLNSLIWFQGMSAVIIWLAGYTLLLFLGWNAGAETIIDSRTVTVLGSYILLSIACWRLAQSVK